MYVGHYAAAAAILAATPDPTAMAVVLPVAIGVAWPDLVWPVLVWAGVEKVEVDRNDPMQASVRFTWFPYSHSLVLANLLALVPALIFGLVFQTWWAALAFWLGAVSHWLLDALVHVHDLPVVGWTKHDPRVGLGLWTHPRLTFFLEYALLAVAVLAFADPGAWPWLLAGGLVLHLFNVNSFFGITRTNPFPTGRIYATVTLIGYAAAIAWFVLAWG